MLLISVKNITKFSLTKSFIHNVFFKVFLLFSSHLFKFSPLAEYLNFLSSSDGQETSQSAIQWIINKVATN